MLSDGGDIMDEKKVKPVDGEQIDDEEDMSIVDKFFSDRKKSGKKKLMEVE
jgi:hypothetical protein